MGNVSDNVEIEETKNLRDEIQRANETRRRIDDIIRDIERR